MLDISIVIPCADDLRLKNCLQSIDEQAEIIVALNGATNDVKNIVHQFGVAFCELEERNVGAACTLGIEAATKNYILIMNTDCIFEKGAIRRFYEALQSKRVVRGQVLFQSTGWMSRVVANAREDVYANPHLAYSPGIGFKKDIINSIGYFYDRDIHWSEDADFTRRLNRAGIFPSIISDAVIYHAPLTFLQDLTSAYRYGTGRRIAEEKQLEGTDIPHSHRFNLKFMLQQFLDIKQSKNIATALYQIILWDTAFRFGYYSQKLEYAHEVRYR